MLLLLCLLAAAAAQEALPAAATYSVESTLLLAEGADRGRELGYRLAATLQLTHSRLAEHDLLLHFTLSDTHVMSRGVRAHAEWRRRVSSWDTRAGAEHFYARLQRGRLATAWLDPADPLDVLNYKRALLSLFQFSVRQGEVNETDVSGDCSVLYERLSDTEHRKIKRACSHDGGAGVRVRRAARYTLGARGVLRALHAEEVVSLAGAGAGAAELKARSWHALQLRAEEAGRPHAPELPPQLREHELPLPVRLPAELELQDEDAPAELEAAVQHGRAALEEEAAGVGGGAASAAALLRLLPPLRAASSQQLLAVLQDARNHDVLVGLSRAAGVAGTAASAAALRDFTRAAAGDALEPLALAFLAGLALAPHVQPQAALVALRLAEEARRPAVADAALLAAGAAASRSTAEARAAVRDAVARSLARCADAACRRVRLLALANLRADHEGGETALAHAERGEPGAALAALAALRRVRELAPARVLRLERVALNASAALEVRAAALEEAVRRRAGGAAGAARLAALARALHGERGGAAHELRRVLWERLETRGATQAVEALLPLETRGWEARARGGTSSVLRRGAGWAGVAGGAALDSLQVAARAVLRRGVVTLLTPAPEGEGEEEELEVELWTRGLQALAGGGGEQGEGQGQEEEEEEEAGAGLGVSVRGARLLDAELFRGQAALLAHVWAGTGAAPAPVLRAHAVLRETSVTLPLQAGVELRARAASAAALALDAHAAVSLWHRTASGALALRAGRAARAEARVATAWAELRAVTAAAAEPALRVAFQLDFYDRVQLCVRAAVPAHDVTEHATVRARGAARARRRRERGLRAPGRTLALGRTNDAACRLLRATDEEDL